MQMTFFNNIYFYILIALIVVHYIIKCLQKFPFVSKDLNEWYMLKALNNFYIKDIVYTLFSVIFYFCCSILVFLIIRTNNLGYSNDIYLVTITFDNCLTFIFMLLSIQYYFKILNLIFYLDVIKLHFYFYQYEFYKKISFSISSNFAMINQIFRPIYNFFDIIISTREDLIQVYKLELNFSKIRKKNPKNIRLYWKFKLCLNIFCKKYVVFNFFFKICRKIFHILYAYSSSFLYYLPHTCLILTILADIHKGIIHYTYYMLLIYYICSIIKKIRRFYYVKDPVYDNIIADYFYNNITSYNQIKDIFKLNLSINQLELNTKNIFANRILSNKEDIINYILNDFQVDYIIDPLRANNNKYLKNKDKRIHVLLLILLLNIYIIYNNNIFIIIYSTIEIELIYITLPLMILLYYIHSKILYNIENTEVFIEWIESKFYSRFFKIIVLFFIIPTVYIIFKNKITVLPDEVLFEIKEYFKIIEILSLEEKFKFLENYLDILKIKYMPEETFWNFFVSKIKTQIVINEETSLNDVKNIVEKQYLETLDKKENIKESLLTRIKNWLLAK